MTCLEYVTAVNRATDYKGKTKWRFGKTAGRREIASSLPVKSTRLYLSHRYTTLFWTLAWLWLRKRMNGDCSGNKGKALQVCIGGRKFHWKAWGSTREGKNAWMKEGPSTEHYLLTRSSSQSVEVKVQRRVEHQRPQDNSCNCQRVFVFIFN